MINLDWALEALSKANGSDLFILPNAPPMIRTQQELIPIWDQILSPATVSELVLSILPENRQLFFFEKKDFNFAIEREKFGRFRVSAFYERNQIAMVLRAVKQHIPSLSDLYLPPTLEKLIMLPRGLILISGAIGSGKSSTLAAMLRHRNENQKNHIISVEDPIEFVHLNQKSIFSQREVGVDTETYTSALQNALRQSPDVIMIGEIRSESVMRYALQFAEVGHLCLATIHASNTYQTINRVINFFPPKQRLKVLYDLSLNLKAILSQRLIPTMHPQLPPLIPLIELLLNSPSVSFCLKSGEVDKIPELMLRTTEKNGLTFDQSLYALVKKKMISYETGLKYADSETQFKLFLKTTPIDPTQQAEFLFPAGAPDLSNPDLDLTFQLLGTPENPGSPKK